MYRSIVTLTFIIVLSSGAVIDNTIDSESSKSSSWCSDDILTCFGIKASAALQRAARSSDTELLPGVSLVREADYNPGRDGKSVTLQGLRELAENLPSEPQERMARLFDMVTDSALEFFKSHSLQIRMPQEGPDAWARALDEGRAKIKKKVLPILMLVGAKLIALIPLALGFIGLMVLKALVVGKLAFVLAAILAFQKFFSGGSSVPSFAGWGKVPVDGWSNGGNTWNAPSSGGSGPYYRSFNTQAAQNLAYSAHSQENQSQSE